jgi:hypothetical protein
VDARLGLGRRYLKGRKSTDFSYAKQGLKPLENTVDKMLDVKRAGKINDNQVLADRNVSIFIMKTMAYESLKIMSR